MTVLIADESFFVQGDPQCDFVWVPKLEGRQVSPTAGYSGHPAYWTCRAHGVSFYGHGKNDVPWPSNCINERIKRERERLEQEKRVRHARKLRVRAWRWASNYFGRIGAALFNKDWQ